MGKKDVLRNKEKATIPVASEETPKSASAKRARRAKRGEGPDGQPLVKVGELQHPARVVEVKKVISTVEPGDRKRYSDDELMKFKTIIQAKLDESNKTLSGLMATLSRADSNDTADTGTRARFVEQVNDDQSREEAAMLASRQEKYITELERALVRIRQKTYGICQVTGKLISKRRLELVPTATMSVEAKQARDTTALANAPR